MYSNLRRTSTLKEIYIVRYADDFKIFCRNHDHAQRIFSAVQQWLKKRLELEISQEKSAITNLRKSNSEFLGIRMRVKPKGKRTNSTGSTRNNFVVESHLTDKVMEKIRGEVRHHARRMQRPVQNKYKLAIGFYNAYVLGVHEYYNCATHCSKDFKDIAYRSRTALRNRLTLRRRRKGDVVAPYIKQRYGKSLELRFHRNCPILPVAYISHQTCLQHSGINRYLDADRQLIHQKQKAVSVDAIRYLLTHPVLDRSVEYNDNRISLFVAQYGKCAVTQRVLNMDDVHCHHKVPRWLGGGDAYANLVIVNSDVHRLIHATTPETIAYYLQRIGLTAAMLKKLNTLRELAKLEPIS